MAQVRIYSTPNCPYCKMTKTFLEEHNIPYENIDVSTDPAAVTEMLDKSGEMGVPQLEIDGKMIVGFDKEAIAQALGIGI